MDEAQIRLSVFIGFLVALTLGELLYPRRNTPLKWQRWQTNLGLLLLDIIFARLLFRAGAVGIAVYAEEQEIGLLHQSFFDASPGAVICLVGIILLDLFIYLQHRLFHLIPMLWRIHRVHHTDVEIDVTTAVRFHPVEIIMSLCIKSLLILLFGIPAFAVLLFEIILNGTAMFNHSNLSIPPALDRFLRYFLVTPDMHRVHHSVQENETNANYGFNLPWWDYIFSTYIASPDKGHLEMRIGLHQWKSPLKLLDLVKMPLDKY